VVGDTCVVMSVDCSCCVLTSDDGVPSRDVTDTVVPSYTGDDVSCLVVRRAIVPSCVITDVTVSFRVVSDVVISSDVVADVDPFSAVYTHIYTWCMKLSLQIF